MQKNCFICEGRWSIQDQIVHSKDPRRQTETERERERETDRQTDRQTDR